MSIALLLNWLDKDTVHSEADDLESVLYTILTVCTYTTGPGTLRCTIPGEKSIPLNRWFWQSDAHELARNKWFLLEHFDEFSGPRLPQYWQDFSPYLKRLVKIFSDRSPTVTLALPTRNLSRYSMTRFAFIKRATNSLNHMLISLRTICLLQSGVEMKMRALVRNGEGPKYPVGHDFLS